MLIHPQIRRYTKNTKIFLLTFYSVAATTTKVHILEPKVTPRPENMCTMTKNLLQVLLLLPISIHFFSRYFAVVFKNVARTSFAFVNGTTIANLAVGGNDGVFHDRTSTNADMIHNDASFQFCTFANPAMAAHHRRFQQHFFGQNAFFTHDRTFSSFIDADAGD